MLYRTCKRMIISIHALCEEGDERPHSERRTSAGFLSTPSARRATRVDLVARADAEHFYPRPLRGGRRRKRETHIPVGAFLSTPSARRATIP